MDRFQNIPPRKRNMIILGTVGGLALLILIIVLACTLPNKPAKAAQLTVKDRIECPGFKDAADCKKHGCEFELVENGPSCYMKKDSFGYKLQSESKTSKGMVMNLTSRSENTPYGTSIPSVTFEVSYITEEIVRVKLFDNQKQRYEVPVQETFPLLQNTKVEPELMAYKVNASSASGIFSFQITRSDDNTVLWDTSIGGLVMSDKFLQISSYLPSTNIYGVGEQVHPTLKHNLEYKTWPIFARDQFPLLKQTNLYGAYPYYTCLEKSLKSHGVLLLNSNAMDVTFLPKPAVSFRTIGGILDLFFIVGKDPEHVVRLYTSLVGRTMMPPYWSLGFQLSRYGYNSIDNLKTVVERTRKAEIAQDVQFLDIDHMEGNRDFTYDKKRFAGLIEYINKTREEYGLKWIIILDPAIEAVKGYHVYESGLKDDVFIKRSPSWKNEMFPEELRGNNVTYGKVWPEKEVAFPNFFDEKAKAWWTTNIVDYHKQLPFDGLWIDMNEPSCFGTNNAKPWYCKDKSNCWSLMCPESAYEDPPYNPLKASGTPRLSEQTLCMESVHSDGKNNYLHYDVHTLYGWSQAQPTYEAAEKAIGRRSLVISRSTYPSSGRHAGHWLGDNKSSWDDLRYSIIGMLEFNIFGIPYIGADVCGFNDDTTPELCTRWMQLGAFYPFFRNHNGMGQKDQDPAALGDETLKASKRAVERRYTLNPYLYTLFYHSHVDGSTVVRPLFHEFPGDENTWNNGEQFMWGRCMLISPVLKQGDKSVRMYLPKQEWWHFKYTQSHLESVKGGYFDETETDDIPLHIRGGCIIPTEEYQLKKSNTDPPKNITLYIFPMEDEATGDIYIDSLNSINPVKDNHYERYLFSYKNCKIDIKRLEPKSDSFDTIVGNIHVFKVKAIKNLKTGQATIMYAFMPLTNLLTIQLNVKLRDLQQISWDDGDNKCQMLP